MSDEIERLIKEAANQANGKPSPKKESEQDTLFKVTGMLLMALAFLQHEMNINKELKFNDGFLEVLQDLTDGATTMIENSQSLDINVRELDAAEVAKLIKEARDEARKK